MSARLSALARLEAIAAGEQADPLVDPANGTRWWIHEDRSEHAVVLLHGITNNPRQYARLGPFLHNHGMAVLVPRFPLHGYRDRLTDALREFNAEDWLMTALEAVSLAAAFGERVSVIGISVGANVALRIAARTSIDTAVAIAPFAGLRAVPGPANDVLAAILAGLPNRFIWWDPRRKSGQPPLHGYPRVPTRALGTSMRLAGAPALEVDPDVHAKRIILSLNSREPAINNNLARRRLRGMERGGITTEVVVHRDLPPNHDVIEPTLPDQRTDLLYPRLAEFILATGSTVPLGAEA